MIELLETSEGRALAYDRRGDGPLVVCHSGGPGGSPSYISDLGGLDELFELVTIHPRGTGESEPPDQPSGYRLEEYVADLEELRAHLGVERMNVLGHSHGGFVALLYAATHRARVNRLVAYGTFARFSDEQRAELAALMSRHAAQPWYDDAVAAARTRQRWEFDGEDEFLALRLRELPLAFYDPLAVDTAAAQLGERWDVAAIRFFNDELAPTFDLRPVLGRIEAPTLIVSGEHDDVVGARELADLIPNAELHLLPACGHFAHMECPEAFREAVSGFLAG